MAPRRNPLTVELSPEEKAELAALFAYLRKQLDAMLVDLPPRAMKHWRHQPWERRPW